MCFFFSFFVEGYQMDPPQLRMICIILRIRNPDQNLDFPLDSNSFQFAKWKPQKKNFGETKKPLRPPTQVHPSPTPPTKMVAQKMGCFNSKNSHQITSAGVFGARKVSANCTIRAQTFRFVSASESLLWNHRGKKRVQTAGMQIRSRFSLPLKRNQRRNWKNVVRSKKSPMQAASPHPQEWPWHSTPQRSVGPRPTKWDGDVGQHSKPADATGISMWKMWSAPILGCFTVSTHLIS